MLYGTAKRTPSKRRMAGTPTPSKVKKVRWQSYWTTVCWDTDCTWLMLRPPPPTSVYLVQRHLDHLHSNQLPEFRPGWNLVPVLHPETASVCQQGTLSVYPLTQLQTRLHHSHYTCFSPLGLAAAMLSHLLFHLHMDDSRVHPCVNPWHAEMGGNHLPVVYFVQGNIGKVLL